MSAVLIQPVLSHDKSSPGDSVVPSLVELFPGCCIRAPELSHCLLQSSRSCFTERLGATELCRRFESGQSDDLLTGKVDIKTSGQVSGTSKSIERDHKIYKDLSLQRSQLEWKDVETSDRPDELMKPQLV